MASENYAELISRTHYSFLRGASHPSEMIARAAELGLAALGVTDRDGVYGIPKAYRAVQQHSPLKLIVGAELSFEDQTHLHLLAKDRRGYGLLCRLLTASHAGQEKGKAAISWSEFFSLMQRSESQGLIALSLVEGQAKGAERLSKLRDCFGDRLYLALSRVLDGRDSNRTQEGLLLSRKWDVPLVATNDVHFHLREKRALQDVLTAIRENQALDQMGSRIFSNGERYLKSAQEMALLFSDLPEALENTLMIADACRFSPQELRYYYPSEWIPAGETSQSYLEKMTFSGARKRYPQGIPSDVTQQLQYELRLISELKFADYFLTIWEIVEFAREKKILCQGRGSAANSVVCYCLGITAIDPVRMNLLFERFISVERGEPPDIDVDFEHERREEVIQHIYEKYGRDRAGMVSAIITYRTRSAIRDLTKALGEQADEEKIQALMPEIKGFPRHLSIHSGGFTLSADPIVETVPIEPARMEGRTIVQWDKEDLDYIGLLKVDVLALGMLTALRKTFDLVEERGVGKRLDIAAIPADDRLTYQMIRRADTIGVFQIESRAQMSMLPRLLPENFYDLVVEVAIVRPGPIQGQMVHPYLKRRRKQEDATCPDPRLEPILGRTLGVPLFQEQVMKIAMVMAGFSPGEADELRRAIGAWRSSGSIERIGMRLKKGLLESGLSVEFTERIFRQIQGFAEYGFPESHAASFALLAYASAYLKCHYPAEFCCALLNSQPMGFYSSHTLVEDVKHHGVRVLPVDPHTSNWDCTMESGALRVGWRVVKGMSKEEADQIIQEREKRAFQSLKDFLSRIRINPVVLNRLALADAFVCFGLSQRETLWEILSFRELYRPSGSRKTPQVFEQLNLFSFSPSGMRGEHRPLGEGWLLPYSEFQAIQSEYASYRLSVRGHPMAGLRQEPSLRKKIPPMTTRELKRAGAGTRIRMGGLVIVRQRPPTAKGTVFATLEDEWGFADLILRPEVFERNQDAFEGSPFVVVVGTVQRDGTLVQVIIQSVRPLFDAEVDFRNQSEDAVIAPFESLAVSYR